MKPEDAIRYGAAITAISAFAFAELIRDYVITVVTVVVFFLCSLFLTLAVVSPEEITRWYRERKL